MLIAVFTRGGEITLVCSKKKKSPADDRPLFELNDTVIGILATRFDILFDDNNALVSR